MSLESYEMSVGDYFLSELLVQPRRIVYPSDLLSLL
jgi:hypothetical protein